VKNNHRWQGKHGNKLGGDKSGEMHQEFSIIKPVIFRLKMHD
jgi:hypothetical protein